jgi:hypothetical protein
MLIYTHASNKTTDFNNKFCAIRFYIYEKQVLVMTSNKRDNINLGINISCFANCVQLHKFTRCMQFYEEQPLQNGARELFNSFAGASPYVLSD